MLRFAVRWRRRVWGDRRQGRPARSRDVDLEPPHDVGVVGDASPGGEQGNDLQFEAADRLWVLGPGLWALGWGRRVLSSSTSTRRTGLVETTRKVAGQHPQAEGAGHEPGSCVGGEQGCRRTGGHAATDVESSIDYLTTRTGRVGVLVEARLLPLELQVGLLRPSGDADRGPGDRGALRSPTLPSPARTCQVV